MYQKLPKTLKLLCPASWKRRKTIQIIDQNHAYVLGIPGLMKRMCRLLERISRKTFPSQNSISPTAGQATPSTRTHTPQEQHMDHMAAALRAALMENPAEEGGMDELAFMLGLPRESLLVSISKRRERASRNGSTVVDNFYSSTLPSNLFYCLWHVSLHILKQPKQIFF